MTSYEVDTNWLALPEAVKAMTPDELARNQVFGEQTELVVAWHREQLAQMKQELNDVIEEYTNGD